MIDTFAPGLFRGKKVLVVGGTSGIGLGAVRAFSRLGAQIVATGATEAECIAAANAAESTDIGFTVLDVRDGAAIEMHIAELERLDVLDEYRGAGLPPGTRGTTWRCTLRAPDRTLTEREIDTLLSRMLKALEGELDVRRRQA